MNAALLATFSPRESTGQRYGRFYSLLITVNSVLYCTVQYCFIKNTHNTHKRTHTNNEGKYNGEAEYNSKPPNLSPAGILEPASLDLHPTNSKDI
jgi:hypothetical protein